MGEEKRKKAEEMEAAIGAIEVKTVRANVRRDCTVSLPPDVVEEIKLVCGKGAVEFIIFGGDPDQASDVNVRRKNLRMVGEEMVKGSGGAFIMMRAAK